MKYFDYIIKTYGITEKKEPDIELIKLVYKMSKIGTLKEIPYEIFPMINFIESKGSGYETETKMLLEILRGINK